MPERAIVPLSPEMRQKLEQSLREYEAAKRGEGAFGAVQRDYEAKFLKLLEEVKDRVDEFLSNKLDPQRRMLFAYAADELLKGFIEEYTNAIEVAANRKKGEMGSNPVYVETVEIFKEAFYDTMWPALPPSIALRKASGWAGRTTDYELAGYDEAIKDKEAGVHIPGSTLILDKKTGAIIGKEPKREGIGFEAIWPLEKYVFPHDPKLFKRVEEILNKLARKDKQRKGIGSRKYEQEHGPKHLFNAVRYASRIIERERKRPGIKPINEHVAYTMTGFHDFWRACDVDVALYNLAIEDVPDVSIVKQKLWKQKGAKLEDLIAGARTMMHASAYFENVREQLRAELEAIRLGSGLVFFEQKAKAAIEALDSVMEIMKKTLQKEAVVLDIPSGQRERILKQILELAQTLKSSPPPGIDSRRWTALIDAFLRNLPNTKNFADIKTEVARFKGQATIEMNAAVIANVVHIEELIKDLGKKSIVFRDKRRDELTKIEDEAVAKIEIIEKALQGLNPEYYDKWKKKLEIIKANILLRRRKVKASYAHPELGGDENAWIPVAVFLDMLGYPFYYPEVMNYIKVHDYKFIIPKSFEGKIAKDADLLDGIGPAAVERTYYVGKSFGNKYFDPGLTLDQRFEYLRTGIKSPDTVSVILSLCFDWPQMLSTEAAKEIVRRDKKVEKMIGELINFSRKVEKLTLDEIELLKKIIEEYRKESPRQVAIQKERAATLSQQELMHAIYYE